LPLAHFVLQFGAPEYFSLVLMGLIWASVVSTGSALRAVAMVLLGILLGTVGTDVNTGAYRFVLVREMADGISLVAVAMGLFGVSEVIASVGKTTGTSRGSMKLGLRGILPTRAEMAGFGAPAGRGSAIGSAFGTLPGTGAAIASFMAYALEKRIRRVPDAFGRGQPRGIVAPEASNNAAAITGFIPTLTLGIPGDSVMALMLGAMIINGIMPGPSVVTDHPTLFWGVIASFIIGNVILV
jgi:TctA family transporter